MFVIPMPRVLHFCMGKVVTCRMPAALLDERQCVDMVGFNFAAK